MMKFRYIIIAFVLVLTVYACKKDQIGFLSDKLLYRANPFTAVKGRVSTSAPLEADGSTQPLNVKLLDVRDITGKSAAALTTEYEIAIYKAEIRSTDTTLAQLNAKLGTGMYKPFNVNSVGGRMEVTPASVFCDTGTYEFDLEVSNIRGSRVFNKIGRVRLTPPNPFQITRQFVSTSVAGQELNFTNLPASAVTVTVNRVAGPNKIIIKFVDKNNVPFNPNAGEVLRRATIGTNFRYHFGQFDPYYAEEKTDTALVFQYPDKVPTFPLYTLNNAYTSSYRIPNTKNDLNLNLNPELGVRLYPFDVPFVSGTWNITVKLNTAARL
jgi:hypothetical protein